MRTVAGGGAANRASPSADAGEGECVGDCHRAIVERPDLPLLTGDQEMLAHRELQEKCGRIKGASLHGLGGTDTHVHLALSIEPFVTISDLVQERKGASSFEVNRRMNRKALEWQRGYGVVSFGKRKLDWVLDYVQRQREHHASGQLQSRLEVHDAVDETRPSPAEAG